VIKAKDPHLHRISIVVPRFLLPEGIPTPKGTLSTQPIPEGIPKVAPPSQHLTGEVTSSQPTTKEENEEEEEKEKEIVDVSNSEDLYEVFNQPPSPVASTSVLGQSTQFNPVVSKELLFFQTRWGFKGSKSQLS